MVEVRVAVPDVVEANGVPTRLVASLDRSSALIRDHIDTQLCGVLDEATGKWGIRVNRVELRAIDQQSQILEAEGAKQSAILRAEGDRQSQIVR